MTKKIRGKPDLDPSRVMDEFVFKLCSVVEDCFYGTKKHEESIILTTLDYVYETEVSLKDLPVLYNPINRPTIYLKEYIDYIEDYVVLRRKPSLDRFLS